MANASVAYGSLPFKEQIEFFRRKANLPTQAWTDIMHEQHDHAFVVAGANRDDLVADFRAAVDKAIRQGATLESFRKDFDQIVENYGWSYNGGRNWRSRVIYETNLRTSFWAGRFVQLQKVKRVRPFWEYMHNDSVQHPRPLHLSWNGLILHADNGWWRTHFTPNGWGCECYIRALSWDDLKARGKSGPDEAPPSDVQTVTVGKNGPTPREVETPAGVDPGFGYTPGASAWGNQVANAVSGTARFPANYAASSAAQMLGRASAAQALDAQFADWLAGVQANPVVKGRALTVGALSPQAVDALAGEGIEAATAPIVLRDADLVPLLERIAKPDSLRPAPISAALLQQLPLALRQASQILLDRQHGILVYVLKQPDGTALAIEVRYQLAGAAPDDVVNTVSAMYATDPARLSARHALVPLED